MRNIFSRILPLLLVVVLALSALPVLAADAPPLPTAAVKEITNEDLTFAMNFTAKDITPEQVEYYGDWFADFELTFSKDVTMSTTDESADGYLSGQYDSWSPLWVDVPGKAPVTLKANEPLRIMSFAAEYMGEPGLKYTCAEVFERVKDFDCGVYLTDEYIQANPDVVINLELKIYNPENEAECYVIGDNYQFSFGFVAKNVQTGKLYTTVADAIREATADQTVQMIADSTEMNVTVFSNVKLDLAGNTLTTNYFTSYGNTVDSSADSTGRVAAIDNCYIYTNNVQLPIRDNDGYMFVDVQKINNLSRANNTEYHFQPFVERVGHKAMLAGTAASDLTVQVQVTWTGSSGTGSQDFVFNDEQVALFLNSYVLSRDRYNKMFSLTLNNAEQFTDLRYNARLVSGTGAVISVDSLAAQVANNTLTQAVTLEGASGSAVVPAGTLLESGTSALTLTATEMTKTTSNITVGDGESLLSMDVCVEGVSKENTTPILVTLDQITLEGLNIGNIALYHVENGVTTEMTRVFSIEEVDAHNEYYYDIETGTITMALASFSEISFVTENTAPWEGDFDYTWYKADATQLTIANADQLAAFSAIVGGMNGQTQDSFKGKTVKLICDINLNDASSEDGKVFYPIGYYNTTGAYTKQSGIEVSSYFNSFEGTFDGNGNTVANFYQNTWEMFGDYNEGYPALSNHYRDGMGLFGHVNGGTVKNLTVENFSSDGEHNTTGCIAAYADCGATFENISIFSCNPRVYNIGNGGIVGCVGWYARSTVDTPVTFRNITVDNTNKISALWGSWDVACGGIVGQYYPTSGQSSYNYPKNGGIHMDNCHVAAQIDVNNDVCANYQYYAYRYAGMMIGSVRENETINGRVYPKMDGITASGCTFTYGDWQNYYYCELEANTMASYSPDYQFSRLTRVAKVEGTKITYLDGTSQDVPTDGRYNYVVVNGQHGTNNATCYHFVNGQVHTHTAEENNQHIYLPFGQLVTGYGWGVTSKGIDAFEGTDSRVPVAAGQYASSVTKFEGVATSVTTGESYTIGQLFKEVTGSSIGIVDNTVQVYVSPAVDENGNALSNVTGTYSAGESWEDGTLTFSGIGAATVTISDYFFCKPVTINVTVTANTVTLFDANGFERVTYGGSTQLRGAEPTEGGATFVGWSTERLEETEVTPTNLFNEGDTYTEQGNTSLYAVYTYDKEFVTGADTWNLVEDVAELKAGDEVVIAASNAAVALSTAQNSNNRGQADIEKSDGRATITFDANSDVQVITLEEGTVSGTFAFYVEGDNTGYLYAASSTKNYLRTQATNNDNGSFTITINAGDAIVTAQGSNTRNMLRYNSGSSIFSCYSSGQAPVSFYKKAASSTETKTVYASIVKVCETHTNFATETVPATCTEDGYTEKFCADCGTTIETTVLPATGHNYVEGVCTNCGKEKSDYNRVTTLEDVTSGEYVIAVKVGNKFYAMASATNDKNKVPPVEITVNDDGELESVAPVWTVSVSGSNVTLRTGDSYLTHNAAGSTDMPLKATSYNWNISECAVEPGTFHLVSSSYNNRGILFSSENNVFAAYAVTNQHKTNYYSDLYLFKAGSVVGCAHENATTVTTEATCTQAGSIVTTCPDCGHTSTETIEKLPHNYVDGSCSVCGTSEIIVPEIPETGVYKLVTDINEIKNGGKFVIVATVDGSYIAMGDYDSEKSAVLGQNVTVNGDYVTTADAPTWIIGKFGENIVLIDSKDAYLKQSSSNDAKLSTLANETYAWAVLGSSEDGVFYIASNEDETRGLVYRTADNSGNTYNYFRSYKQLKDDPDAGYYSGLKLYKLVEEEITTCEHTNTTTTSTATCTEAGVETVTCVDCQEVISTTNVDALGHTTDNGVCGNCGQTIGGTTEPTEKSATLTFDANKTGLTFGDSEQVWVQDGITFTNKKDESQSWNEYTNPIRLYIGSTINIKVSGNITKIVLNASSSSYLGGITTSTIIEGVSNIEIDGSTITLTLEEGVSEINYKIISKQLRLSSIVVTYIPED